MEEPLHHSSSYHQSKENIELHMIEKIQIGKRFQMNIDEISTLTTASLRADLISLEVCFYFLINELTHSSICFTDTALGHLSIGVKDKSGAVI
jgi:hypothetical protein